MLPYQIQYIENARRILTLCNFDSIPSEDYETWYAEFTHRREQMAALRRENMQLMSGCLVPTLDELLQADETVIGDLRDFAAKLMDWSTNLDVGVYVLIHDALLSMYRLRKDRNGIIQELYQLGMGLFYLNRTIESIDENRASGYLFRNEMVFTEAGSYLRFFPEIQDSATKGFIIRALANVALCTRDARRRVAVSARILSISQDEYYRALAPDLPWDVFLQRTHQQMSANRSTLSKGALNAEELAAVLDSCYEVFKPQDQTADPNIRWLWPYYEMEYSCGFVDLATTLSRLERLVDQNPWDQYDMSSLYGNVQLPLYYGLLMRNNPSLQTEQRHVKFLAHAYGKMMKALLSCPVEQYTDFYRYLVRLTLTSYLEIDGVPPYREVALRLMQCIAGPAYIRFLQVGEALALTCRAIFREEPDFFDDIEFICRIRDPEQKQARVLEYARDCGLFYDFGLIKMSLARTMQTRELLDLEYQMYSLHTVSGRDDLLARPSTAIYADVAFGHHAWYDGSGGYPEDYVRNESSYRQMTDVVAVIAYLADLPPERLEEGFGEIQRLERRRFSPLVTAYFSDEQLRRDVTAVLSNDEPFARRYFLERQGEAD